MPPVFSEPASPIKWKSEEKANQNGVHTRGNPAPRVSKHDAGPQRCRAEGMPADRDVVQRRKRAVGVANRPREISSDQARRQKAIFLEKGKKSWKHSLLLQIWGSIP